MEDFLRCLNAMDRCRYTIWVKSMIYLGILGNDGYKSTFGLCCYKLPTLNSELLLKMPPPRPVPLP
jgi:hypothetical protein